mgnify:FL=1
MSIKILAKRLVGPDLTRPLVGLDFEQDQFDHLFGMSRELREETQKQFNLRQDFGEDMLLLMIGQLCVQEFGDLNYQLVHVVYRIIDSEIEHNSLFNDVEFIYP